MKPQALYPGSFDPITLGHTDIISRASEGYDLTIGIAVNPGKNPIFSLQERTRLLQRAIAALGIDPSQVVRVPGSTARYMLRQGIDTIIRGQRDSLDEIAEAQLEAFNRLEHPTIHSEILSASDSLRFASSSAAKMLIHTNHDPSSIISLDVEEALKSRLLSQYPVYITGGMGAGKSSVARALESQAGSVGIPTRYIELDKIAHDIYTSLDEPLYASVRFELRAVFGDEISPDAIWIDRQILRHKLSDSSGNIDPDKLKKIDDIMRGPIEFRYRDMIEGFRGIILIDGIMKDGSRFPRLAHHNILLVDADVDTRVERLQGRYTTKGDTVSPEYIRSMITEQLSKSDLIELAQTNIKREGHGNILEVDNTGSIDPRKSFFSLLNQIDTYSELRAGWILNKLGIVGDTQNIVQQLQSTYNAPRRHYHSWEHIIECLTTLFQMAIDLDLSDEDIAIIGGAILWHDYYYDTTTPEIYATNEERSALRAESDLTKLGVMDGYVTAIMAHIRETKHGNAQIPDQQRSQVMHDIDLGILGSLEPRYDQYARDIPAEFAQMMSRADFHRARIERFIRPTLTRVTELFLTPYGREHFRPRAETNLRSELDRVAG